MNAVKQLAGYHAQSVTLGLHPIAP